MNLDQAREHLRRNLRGPDWQAVNVLLAELDRLEALALEQARLRTLGGIPPVPDRTWGNLAYTTPPASASTADAPPLHRPTTTEPN